MEVFAVQLVRPPTTRWTTTSLEGHVARLMAPRGARRPKADRWADLSRKRLGVVRFTPPKP